MRRADDAANVAGSEDGCDVAQDIRTRFGLESMGGRREGRSDRFEFAVGHARLRGDGHVTHCDLNALIGGEIVGHFQDFGVTDATHEAGSEFDELGFVRFASEQGLGIFRRCDCFDSGAKRHRRLGMLFCGAASRIDVWVGVIRGSRGIVVAHLECSYD
mgnify:CR=1 FL=1